MSAKLRINGETISSDKTYSGARVLGLINISYLNGQKNGRKECNADIENKLRAEYNKGYKIGYEEASDDLIKLKEILSKIIGDK